MAFCFPQEQNLDVYCEGKDGIITDKLKKFKHCNFIVAKKKCSDVHLLRYVDACLFSYFVAYMNGRKTIYNCVEMTPIVPQ